MYDIVAQLLFSLTHPLSKSNGIVHYVTVYPPYSMVQQVLWRLVMKVT